MSNIYNALVVQGRDSVGQPINMACEVQQLLGNNRHLSMFKQLISKRLLCHLFLFLNPSCPIAVVVRYQSSPS
ncbi:hypothetical protein EJD97_018666 [Solanum chilense]|uniref:Uncharacterized protein n=1 Tax=Solanum chilense TaxID=4083 RepID=A0A6N2B8J5_SOLCI|nr:hypothetical protein EJD97_018666 [Solanum chilense]